VSNLPKPVLTYQKKEPENKRPENAKTIFPPRILPHRKKIRKEKPDKNGGRKKAIFSNDAPDILCIATNKDDKSGIGLGKALPLNSSKSS
jgi:hypothetical protein